MERKIVGAKETVKLDIQGNLVTYAVYSYTLDDLGPFTHEIPKRDDTPEALKAAIDAKEALLKAAASD